MNSEVNFLELEYSIVRLEEMLKLYTVICNGANNSTKDEIVSSMHYIYGSLESVAGNIRKDFDLLTATLNQKEHNS